MRARKRLIECEENLFKDTPLKCKQAMRKREPISSFDEEKDYNVSIMQEEETQDIFLTYPFEPTLKTAFKKKRNGFSEEIFILH